MLTEEALNKFRKCFIDTELAEKIINDYKESNSMCENQESTEDYYHEQGFKDALQYVILITIEHCEVK